MQKVIIDLGMARKKELNESFLAMFGWGVKTILKRMFGGADIPVKIKGTKSEVNSFASTLERERRYLDSYRKNGLDDPKTYKNKYELEKAVKNFEKATGLIWPFK